MSSFMQMYLLSEFDALIIMMEYFKFLSIWVTCGEVLSASSWIREFLNHFMTFDTKYYREFYELFCQHLKSECEESMANLFHPDIGNFINKIHFQYVN